MSSTALLLFIIVVVVDGSESTDLACLDDNAQIIFVTERGYSLWLLFVEHFQVFIVVIHSDSLS